MQVHACVIPAFTCVYTYLPVNVRVHVYVALFFHLVSMKISLYGSMRAYLLTLTLQFATFFVNIFDNSNGESVVQILNIHGRVLK